DKLGEHPLGQLLLGLGDGYSRLGDREKAALYFGKIEEKLPGSPWAKRAATWKENGKLTPQEQQCIGCHKKKVCNSSGVITKDQRKILVEKLGTRNSAAHPSSGKIEQLQAEEFIDNLIKNVVLKLT